MSRARELLGLPENAIAPRLGAGIMLAIHAMFIALLTVKMVGGDGTWITAIAWGANVLCAWHRMWQLDWLLQVRSAEVAAKQPSTIDHALFMPYSTCPKCAAEELHWIASPGDHARVYIHHHDVLRECRSCGHVWSQKVGPQ